MKKTIIILVSILLFHIQSIAQWSYKVIDSEFDGSFKKAYTETNNGGYLLMEVGSPDYDDTTEIKRPLLALRGQYFCDDYAYIDFVFVYNEEKKKHQIRGTKTNDSHIYFFDETIWTKEFINDFKNAKKVLIRVNQEYCTNDYYEFNFTSSTAAYNFIIK